MGLLQTAVLAGSIVWGAVYIGHMQTPVEEQQRTEQHAKANYEKNK
ncbi:MAG: hypothetical protein ACHQAX_09320 [Gammaproteobacteria bacterium]